MSDKIIISEKSIIHKFWDEDKRKSVATKLEPKDLIVYLWETVCFHKITLDRIFQIVEPRVEMWEIILGESIKPILEEAKKDYNGKNDLSFLELYWDVCHEKDDNFTTIWPSLHAHGEETDGDGYYYAVDFTPCNYLKKLNVNLNTRFQIYEFCSYEKAKDFGHKYYNVMEAFKGIFYELTWHGIPEKRTKLWEEINNTVNEDCTWVR